MTSNSNDIASLNKSLADGSTDAVSLTTRAVESAERLNETLNAFLQIDAQGAIQRARQVQESHSAASGPLAGIPIAIKDNICTVGLQTSCGSRILGDYHAPYNATAIERLNAAGAVIIGKTNCDEFAMGSSNENSAFGPVRNPWNPELVPGGSSGGSAAAVAAGIVPVALGSETGGSVRQPAALCGIVGLKPTYGRISRYGLVAFASSLDQIIAGRDVNDATSADVPVPDYVAGLGGDLKGSRIGVPRELFGEGLDPEVRASVERGIDIYRDLGAEIVDVELPHSKYSIAVYYILATAEASSNLARYDGVRYGFRAENVHELREMYKRTRDEGFGAEVKRRIMLGTYVLSSGYYDAYYRKAQQVRQLIKDDFSKAFQSVDVIVTPTTPTPAFRLGEKTDDPLEMYLNDIYTCTANLAGIPGISVPSGLNSAGLPIGLQLVGPHWSEPTLLKLADAFETANPLGARPRIYADDRIVSK
jgi:aspartyl-tRNA(Asn)/glutamyl-tRNA(Gln) amidotransferase subunit A